MAADFIAGLNGGVAGVLVGHPFDTVKIRLQTQDPLKPRYNGVLHCFALIARQETPLGLFKGMSAPLVTISCVTSCLFGSQAICLRRLDRTKLSNHFLSGAFAGAVVSFLQCPVELARIKIQLQGIGQLKSPSNRGEYSGSIDAFFKILQAEGVRGVYRGMGMTLARETLGLGVYFWTVELMSRAFTPHSQENKSVAFPYLLLTGGITGIACWVSIYPFDVIKTRFQRMNAMERKTCPSYRHLVKKCYAEEGFGVFGRGLTVTLLRAFPVNAAVIATVVLTKRALGVVDQESASTAY